MIRANIGEMMDKLEINVFNNLIENQENTHLVDGLPYCNICKEPRFYKRDEWILPAKCKCQTDKERLQKEKERIEQAETGRLLNEDLTAMRDFFQTDIEEITDYKIKAVDITDIDETLICAVVTIEWELYGTNGKEHMEEIYSVIAQKQENSYKLVQFF